MNCPNCGKKVLPEHTFCPFCGQSIDNLHNKQLTYSLRCKSCGSIMNIQSEKRILSCPSCGSKEIIIESDAVTIERIRSSTQLTMQREAREHEREKRVYEDTKANNKDKESKRFNIKLLLGFILFTFMIVYIAGAVNSNKTNSNKKAGNINPPISSKASVGEDYHLIEQQFRDAGFINVTTRPLNDLVDTSILEKLDLSNSKYFGEAVNEENLAKYNDRVDKIESIMMGSDSSFSTSDWFSPDTNVFIYYHSKEASDSDK